MMFRKTDQAVHKKSGAKPTIALLLWGHVIEDFLDPLKISLEAFCTEFRGSWAFDYVDALQLVDVQTVIFCISSRISEKKEFTHSPTGCTICILPVPYSYRIVSNTMNSPYSTDVKKAFSGRKAGKLPYPILLMMKEIAPYLSTPLISLSRELKHYHCQAILCQEYEFPRFDICVFLGRLTKLPVFAVFQGGDSQLGHLEKALRPISLHSCSGLIIAPKTESNRVLKQYGISLNKIAQIFNPIDLKFWEAVNHQEARNSLLIPHNARVAIWHGRISMHVKGLDILLSAWKIIQERQREKDLQLIIIGTGQDADKLSTDISSLNLSGIRWINEFINDRNLIRWYLSAADTYVFPSRHEGFPVAPIQAMSCGLPVVATDVSGILEILDEGDNSGGLIVPQESPEELALALMRVLDDPKWSRQLGQNARRRIEEYFSLEQVGKQLKKFSLTDSPLT